jgi:hypothetical protein
MGASPVNNLSTSNPRDKIIGEAISKYGQYSSAWTQLVFAGLSVTNFIRSVNQHMKDPKVHGDILKAISAAGLTEEPCQNLVDFFISNHKLNKIDEQQQAKNSGIWVTSDQKDALDEMSGKTAPTIKLPLK